MEMSELINRFTYHRPKNSQSNKYEAIRDKALKLAKFITVNLPEGREQSLAITKLEEMVFWANAGIAREVITGTENN